MPVRYQRIGAAAVVVLDRPEARNALDQAMLDELGAAFERFEHDTDARALVITGAGDRAFCAGADLRAIAAGWRPTAEQWPVLGRNVHIARPVVAAVNGDAFGGGFNLAQSCDLCVAAASARFAISEARFGRVMDWAALLPRTVPARIAMELMLTAEPIDADRAQAAGLVNAVAPGADVLAAALDLVERIAANVPASVIAAKAMVHRSIAAGDDALADDAAGLFAAVLDRPDALDRATHFTNHRDHRTGEPGA